ncbi:trimethylamine methyltransferase family protein [Aestuariivirga sp.]|uniref:trimethylamine methyltransferase family protein n=1 Tax=Aestuariivirga sp. TaxID=2650926 RepID=UPI0039E3B52D
MTDVQPAPTGRRARGGADARRAARTSTAIRQAGFIRRKIKLYEPFSDEQLELIERNAETVLQETGIDFYEDEEAVAMWKNAGADVKVSEKDPRRFRVRFPKGLVRSLIKTAPREYTQYARNPENNVVIGGNNTVFAPVYGPPFIRNLDEGRRYATIEDFRNFAKLVYMLPSLHHAGGTLCEPVDIPVAKRHLDMTYTHIKYSDKPFMSSVTAGERAADSVAMCELLFGKEFVDQNCVMTSLINANSPMVWDGVMLGALKVLARANQACVISPFIVAGAMSPTTTVGTLTQILAEASVGIAFTQLCRPGAPVVFGTFAASMSMQSGAPTFGTPEPALVTFGAAQLARRMGVPFRSGGGLCGSKIPDAQAAYESSNTLWPTLLSGVNFCLHAAGWLEGGLASGYEKLIMDADQLSMFQKFCEGADFTENGQAMDAIAEVGPGSHYLGSTHTQANFETAFWRSGLADNNSFEQWRDDGEKDIVVRANTRWKKLLSDYEAPALDPGIDESLTEFMAKRKAVLPDSVS